MRHLFFALALTCATLLAAPQARAQEEPRTYGIAELKLGAYRPQLDREFGGAASYDAFFGDTAMVHVEGEWDMYVLDWYGRYGLGLHAGFTQNTADVLSETDDAPGQTTLRVIPLRLSLVGRWDHFARRHGIPLVPTLKLGVDYYLWRVLASDGETASAQDVSARGGKLGWHISPGLHLLLDPLAPESAASMQRHWGVDNTYLFGEFLHADVDGFGAEGFDLGSNQWLFGVAVEF